MDGHVVAHGMFWGHFPEMAILGVIFWAGLIIAIGGLIRGATRGKPPLSALRMLEERYARGEIDREEFLERRSVLTDREPVSPA